MSQRRVPGQTIAMLEKIIKTLLDYRKCPGMKQISHYSSHYIQINQLDNSLFVESLKYDNQMVLLSQLLCEIAHLLLISIDL